MKYSGHGLGADWLRRRRWRRLGVSGSDAGSTGGGGLELRHGSNGGSTSKSAAAGSPVVTAGTGGSTTGPGPVTTTGSGPRHDLWHERSVGHAGHGV